MPVSYNAALDLAEIQDCHKERFEGAELEDGEPGAFKDKPNGVWDDALAGYVFEATSPESTEAELEALLAW